MGRPKLNKGDDHGRRAHEKRRSKELPISLATKNLQDGLTREGAEKGEAPLLVHQ